MPSRLPLGVALVLSALVLGACGDEPASTLLDPAAPSLARAGVGAPAPVTMLTRNLYLGADIDIVLSDPINGPAAAWQELQYTDFRLRVAELAEEIATRGPDLVGLQEVSRYEVYMDFGAGNQLVAVIDFLDLLVEALGLYGASYGVVEDATNLTVPLSFVPPGGAPTTIVYADGDAILAKPEVDVHASGSSHYDAQVTLPFGLGENLRGYQWADVSVAGQRLYFVNTHMEVQQPPSWGAIQEQQAAELLDFVNTLEGPVFMVGDFNSAANPDAPDASRTATYGMVLDAGFDDLWLRHHGQGTTEGLTCCQVSDLSNDVPDLNQRIDFVFGRNVPAGAGYAGGAELEVVGEDPEADRFTTLLGYDLWPSDHAGVFAELWMPRGLLARR